MTREELNAWVFSLKPGDVVIHETYNNLCTRTVEKVTPSGIVKTDGGHSFKLSNWYAHVPGRGKTCGEIKPATDDLLQEAESQERQRRFDLAKRNRIAEAVHAMSNANTENVSYDFAVEFLKLRERYGIRH